MNTRLGKSFGLAFVVAVGILALMLALGTFNAQKASAQAAKIDKVQVQPTGPAGGEATHVRVNFTSSIAIVEGQPIAITLEAFDVPSDIPTSEVSIRSSAKVGNPASVSVSGSTITMVLGKDSDGVGMELTAATAASVTFTKNAGITAPVAAGKYDVTVKAGGGTLTVSDAFTVSRTVSISPTSGDSSTKIEVTGNSFTDGAASIYVTVKNDTDIPDASPSVGNVTISGGKFTTTISISVGTTGTDKFQNGAANFIQVVDAGDGSAASGAFTLNGKVTVTPTTLVKGSKRVTVKLEDANGTITVEEVKIGGVSVLFGASGTLDDDALTIKGTGIPKTDDDGDVSILIDVPGTVGTGSKKLTLYASGDVVLGSTTVEITALTLTLTPDTAVPGQSIDLDGSGFGSGAAVTTLTVGNSSNLGVTRQATTNGRFFITFDVPDVADGPQTVTLTDDTGKIGEGTLMIRKPTITIDPASGRRGTPVTVSGTGFPASDSITVTYKGNDAGFARSDSSGNWETVITVPPIAVIGKESNIVGVRKGVEGSKTERQSDAVKHMVPESELTLSTASAASGQMVTITGTGFPPYSSITVEFGNNGASPVGVNTDENGDFTAQVQVPLLTPGTSHLVKVVVKGPTDKVVTELFTIATKPVVTTKSSADAFADLIAADNLIVVWHFDNGTKAWSFYDPRPEVAAAVDLTEVDTGDNVWVQITADQTFQGEMLTAGWNLVTLD